jgi:hypothetical protein
MRCITLVLSLFALGFVSALILVQNYIVPSVHANVTVTDFDKGNVAVNYTDLLGHKQTLDVPATVALQLPDRASYYGKWRHTCERIQIQE